MLTSGTVSLQAVFHSFLFDDYKQNGATTAARSKYIMVLLQNRKVLITKKSTIWENTDGCSEQYRYATALYLLSMLSHLYSIIIDRGVGAPAHCKYVVDVFNVNDIRFLTMLMTTVKLPGADNNYSQRIMHTTMSNTDISIARVFKNIFQTQHVHMD